MHWLYMEQMMKFYYRSRAACHAKQASCVNSKPTMVHAGHAMRKTLLESSDFFSCDFKFNCWWGMFILLQKFAEPWIFERSWVMTDHVFIWMSFYKLQPGVQLQAVRWIFLLTDEGCLFLINTTAVKQFWITDDWLWFLLTPDYVLSECGLYELQPGLFSCKQLGDFFSTDERSSSPQKVLTIKLIWVVLRDDHVPVE